MNFCPNCGTLLKIVEYQEKKDKIFNYCSNCEYEEENKEIVIESIKKNIVDNIDISKDIVYDNSWPRTKNFCPKCSKSKTDLKEMIIYTKKDLKGILICCECDNK